MQVFYGEQNAGAVKLDVSGFEMTSFLYEIKKISTWTVFKNKTTNFVTFVHFGDEMVVYTR